MATQPVSKKPRAPRDSVNSWCVWTKSGRRPSFFHPTRDLAEAEALRLAEKTPGKKFLVMHIVSKIGVDAPVATADTAVAA